MGERQAEMMLALYHIDEEFRPIWYLKYAIRVRNVAYPCIHGLDAVMELVEHILWTKSVAKKQLAMQTRS
jgi:hypothetical protein